MRAVRKQWENRCAFLFKEANNSSLYDVVSDSNNFIRAALVNEHFLRVHLLPSYFKQLLQNKREADVKGTLLATFRIDQSIQHHRQVSVLG